MQKEAKPSAPQNIFDDPIFFENYRQLRENDSGLNGLLELPALYSLLPELGGLSILDLGCGFGDFARYARRHGAAHIYGVDVSEKMLAQARADTNDENIVYQHLAIEHFQVQEQRFDLAVSSLALHYIEDFSALCKKVFASLKPGGQFIFSVEHPMCTAFQVGWVPYDKGDVWPVDHYQEQTLRHTTWFVDDVQKYHRTVETYVNTLLDSGFAVTRLLEPKPRDEAVALRPDLANQCRRPPFLLLRAAKL
ncbi:class I SAM-dependent methyltransferase [Enterobacteriaceae bacterium H20N1]|uniref:Class I SAM-dependent methyltransferase n=1 Tax=Dryocola boscaweniae TaxID=2925397 RepID=A0A9X3AR28_9ENTR|nr:class I SAM-dependent methyltransferase [Dryocola boscaweniae]MCT4704150.1 class I SAM-dependent methyltransferase [Dryocola boscaweniae]MCT4717332.1 class I SAM-dependent methyltransferase [Dryocola boscaweniae]MCT4721318.1 class I SAM-dependent methyltransferase [Dryocola boscaweniae]